MTIQEQVAKWNGFIKDKENYMVIWNEGKNLSLTLTSDLILSDNKEYTMGMQFAVRFSEQFFDNLTLYQLRKVDINTGFVIRED